MDCPKMFARLSEYLDGELPSDLCDELARHLGGCPACASFTRTLRHTIDLCRQLLPKPMPEGLRQELQARLMRERTG